MPYDDSWQRAYELWSNVTFEIFKVLVEEHRPKGRNIQIEVEQWKWTFHLLNMMIGDWCHQFGDDDEYDDDDDNDGDDDDLM